jgi:hypothetical protein
MTIPSISKQIATVSKVNTAAATQLYSDRRHNPEEMSCPMWDGMDVSGRPVCADSFSTKMEGCNTAEDRIFVENNLRPHYSSYLTLDAAAIKGDIYDSRSDIISATTDSSAAYRSAIAGKTPQFGTVSSKKIRPIHGNKGSVVAANAYASQDADAALSQRSRMQQARVVGNSVRLANPAGDYEYRGPGGAYITLGSYNKYSLPSSSSRGGYATLGDIPRM